MRSVGESRAGATSVAADGQTTTTSSSKVEKGKHVKMRMMTEG